VDGELNSRGNLEINSGENLQLNFNGDANLANLITRDKIKNKDLLKWSDLQLQKINFDLGKQTLNLEKVIFEQPYLRLTIKKDGNTNISELIIPQPKTSGDTESAPMRVNIDKIELKQGHSDFADYSLILPFVTEIKALNGSINSISSEQEKPAKLSLQGKVFDLALVDIKGDYQLKNGDSDITLSFTHMPLPLITPYMAEFAGYTIEKGQMALDLKYTIKKGELQAQNKIYIDQLALGDHVINPNASSLPIHLAIALLKDSSGKINLDFPVSGSLNDPHFSVESFIADVLSNMITKVAASPFTALGSLLDQDRDYSAVKFKPGSSDLSPEETNKLDQLGKALNTKAELNIEIKGVSYQNQDWSAIRFDSILEILRKMKSGELRDQGQKIRSEYIELSESEYKRLIVKFFKEVFPLEPVEMSLFGTPKLKSQPDADFYVLARQKLESAMPPEPQRLNDLAVSRANNIAKYLIEKCQVNRDSIYILATELNTAENHEIMSVLSLNASP
jgi:outer membrane protein OmpA-like peptidoglycan-associated protein